MPKTFEQLTILEKYCLGLLYRNLQYSGFRKAIIGTSNYTFIHDLFGLNFNPQANRYLSPSEYVQLMQAIYEIYGWGSYDDEDELVWLWNKIKSEDFRTMVRNTYGNVNYLQLVTLISIHKKDFNLRIRVDEL